MNETKKIKLTELLEERAKWVLDPEVAIERVRNSPLDKVLENASQQPRTETADCRGT